jgi:hypothetical protein
MSFLRETNSERYASRKDMIQSRFLQVILSLRAILLVFLILIGCSGGPPDILDVFYRVNLVNDQEQGMIYQKLSLFIMPDDPDGYEDLDLIYLIHDKEELFWTLDSQSWQKVSNGRESWIGSNSFCMPDNSDLPQGTYRILLKDLSGEKAETQIFLRMDSVDKLELKFPDAAVRDGRIFVESAYEENQILIYERGNVFRHSFSYSEGGLALGEIFSTVEDLSYDFTFFVYAFDQKRDLGLVKGPFSP